MNELINRLTLFVMVENLQALRDQPPHFCTTWRRYLVDSFSNDVITMAFILGVAKYTDMALA